MKDDDILGIKHPTDTQLGKFLKYYDLQSKMFMPNEIFEDLKDKYTELYPDLMDGEAPENAKSKVVSSHLAFTYSYYYLISWLYRYCKYDSSDIDVKTIKKALAYSHTTKTIDFIIKKGGVLDQMGYTFTSTDYPVYWEYEQGGEFGRETELKFTYSSELIDGEDEGNPDNYFKLRVHGNRGSNFKIKHPVKGLWRTKESEEDGLLDGTFYDVSKTHLIQFEIFLFCMGNKNLGCTAFYLYSYLKRMNDVFSDGYDVSIPALAYQTGIKERTLIKYLTLLKKHRMINCRHNQEYYVAGLPKEKRMANTYFTNDYIAFSDQPLTVKPIKTITLDKYNELHPEQDEFNPACIDEAMWGLEEKQES